MAGRIRIIIETRGPIQNYETHVALPLARIVANALTNMVDGAEQISTEQVEIEHRTGIELEAEIDVAVSIDTSYDDRIFRNKEAVRDGIAQAIHQNGMFRYRYRHEPNDPKPINRVRLELNLGVRLPALEVAEAPPPQLNRAKGDYLNAPESHLIPERFLFYADTSSQTLRRSRNSKSHAVTEQIPTRAD